MLDTKHLIRAHILEMEPYSPILPFEVLSEQLGIPSGNITKLDANENPFGLLPQVRDALANIPFAHIYPDPESRILRKAIAAHFKIPFDNILAGAGADELIDLIMRLILDPGDSILNCPPTFGMYAFDAQASNARLVNIPRHEDFSLDLPAIHKAVQRHQPKILFLANPNNPDGGLLAPEILESLLSLPMLVVVDEAYIDFSYPGSSQLSKITATQRVPENLVVLRTFSKWAGLAGLRAGFGVFPDWMMPHLFKVKQPYNLSVAASAAAVAALQAAASLETQVQQMVAERERLSAGLEDIPWMEPYPSQANFILCRVIGRSAAAVKEELANAGILIRYFDKPGLRDHLRISVGKAEHTDHLLASLQQM